MIQQLASATGGTQPWVIASMLFFVAVFFVVAVRLWRTKAEDAEGFARIPLAEDELPGARASSDGSSLHDQPASLDADMR